MKQLDLGKTKVNKIFWIYVVPSIFSIIFSTTAQFVDSAFIGRYVGENGLAAITMLFPFIMLLNGISIMIAIGGVTYAGINRGRNNYKRSNNFFNLTLFMIVVAAVISTGLFLVINNFFEYLFNVDEVTLGYIQTYGFWIGLFFIFFMFNMTFTLFLNLDKKPVLVVIVSSLSTLINVGLNYLFIVTMGMGMMGAALASGISQFIPSCIFLYIIFKKSTWKFKFPRIKFDDMWRIIIIGSSELVNISSVAVAGFILNKVILYSVGITGVAGFAIAMQLGNLVISFAFGVSDAIQSPLSYNYGAGLFDRVKKILFKAIKLNIIFGFIMMILSTQFGDVFAKLLVTDSETITYAKEILEYYGFAFILMGVNVVLSTYYTSVDSPLISGIISIFKSLIYLVVWLLILPPLLGNTGIWIALVAAEVSTSITALLIFLRYPYGNKIIQSSSNKPLLKVQ